MAPPVCLIHCIFFMVAGAIGNIMMVCHMFIKGTVKRKPRIMISHLAVINIVFPFYMIIYAFVINVFTSVFLQVIFCSLRITFSLMLLGANIALAYDRYLSLSQPFKYRIETSLKLQSRMIIANISISSILGTISCYFTVAWGIELAERIVISCSRVFTYAVLGYAFFATFRAVKNIQPTLQQESHCGDAQLINLKARRERAVRRLAIGVMVSFAICNLPAIIYNTLYRMSTKCNTVQDKWSAFSISMLTVNVLFDPLWYLYTIKSNKSAFQPSTKLPANTK